MSISSARRSSEAVKHYSMSLKTDVNAVIVSRFPFGLDALALPKAKDTELWILIHIFAC